MRPICYASPLSSVKIVIQSRNKNQVILLGRFYQYFRIFLWDQCQVGSKGSLRWTLGPETFIIIWLKVPIIFQLGTSISIHSFLFLYKEEKFITPNKYRFKISIIENLWLTEFRLVFPPLPPFPPPSLPPFLFNLSPLPPTKDSRKKFVFIFETEMREVPIENLETKQTSWTK